MAPTIPSETTPADTTAGALAIDVDKVRADTRGCEQVVHFNNAGASLMPAPVADCLYAYLRNEEHFGGYETAAVEHEAVANFYDATARLLSCQPNEIAFVENATRAWDMAFYSFRFEQGDQILTSVAEYGSNVVAYLQQAERYGAEIVVVPDDDSGQLDTAALANLINERTKLISISHIPTGGGLVNPAKRVGQLANEAGVPYLLDSCQGVGQLPLDVDDIGCDILSGTGRKYLRGPRGTGLLYVRSTLVESLDPPLLDQHAAPLVSPTEYRIVPDAKRFENWERYFAGQAALGVAIDYALNLGLPAIQQRVYALADSLRAALAQIPGVVVTDQGIEQCGIVTFTADRLDATAIKAGLAAANINVSVSSGSGSMVSFHQRGLTELVRASVHYFNTDDEITHVVETLTALLGPRRAKDLGPMLST